MTTVHEPTTTAADLSVWPASTTEPPHGELAVGGVPLTEVAERFGTPVYVLDEAEVRARCRTYRDAFPEAEVLYAAKVFLCRAMAHWVAEEGLGLDVCSAGELELAVTTGFPPERIVLHGNAKSPRDLETALRLGVGRIVIDSPAEIARLAAAVGPDGHQKVMVRVVPGISAGGHEKIRTGTDDQKFGLSIADGYAQHAIARILDQPQLELTGLHCHLGSQIAGVKPYLAAVRRLVGLMTRLYEQHGLTLPELDLGGGHGIAYRPGEEALDLTALARRVQRGTHRRVRDGRPPRAPPDHRTRPGDRGPRGHSRLPRPGGETHGRHGVRGRGRRHERQPAPGPVRRPLRTTADRPGRHRGPGPGDRGGPALRGRRRPGRRRGTPRRHPPR
ncbi:Diaminopimelate decarboxylase [Streptomyces canarius]